MTKLVNEEVTVNEVIYLLSPIGLTSSIAFLSKIRDFQLEWKFFGVLKKLFLPFLKFVLVFFRQRCAPTSKKWLNTRDMLHI